MSNVPTDLLYTREHEWVRVAGNAATIGITDNAQRQLGDIVFVELPTVGQSFSTGDEFGTIESVKAVSEVFMPVDATVTAINDALNDEPEVINTDPYGDGWMLKISVTTTSQLAGLLTPSQYSAYLAEESA